MSWKDPSIDAVSLAVSAAWSYAVGIVIGNLVFLPLSGMLIIPSVIGAFLLTWPILVGGILVALLFRRNVETHLLVWCVITPVAVTIAYLIVEHFVLFARQGMELSKRISDPVSWSRAALALTCASIAAVHFYRRHARN